jgi:hypothetical protein
MSPFEMASDPAKIEVLEGRFTQKKTNIATCSGLLTTTGTRVLTASHTTYSPQLTGGMHRCPGTKGRGIGEYPKAVKVETRERSSEAFW